jgi:hypothetical protein
MVDRRLWIGSVSVLEGTQMTALNLMRELNYEFMWQLNMLWSKSDPGQPKVVEVPKG